ncbi:hypothetical protein G6F44_008042 [Rhizopus delemar]|nr:hypothetical protein G6F44_008042 [Rhizopus delemar]
MRISKLDPSVIKRIAAGETIQRPVNVIKEMMENSLDAGSKHIHISVTKSGFDMIKVKDDGHGIQRDDLSIICERHTTSKIETFSDLSQLSTFGFRGEALASISNVSNVQGLFENMPQRRKALKSGQEEYGHIQTCVQNYAIHYYQISFILKREEVVDLNYPSEQAQIDRIQRVLGKFVASHVKCTEYCNKRYKCTLLYSDMTEAYPTKEKNAVFILFVNNHLVDNLKMKRQLYKVYADMKTNYKPPFLYISLRIDPSHVDVNVHPTKKELYLLNEQNILHDLCQLLHDSISLPLLKDKQEKRDRVPQTKATLDHYFKKVSRKDDHDHQSVLPTSQQEVPKHTPDSHRPQRHRKNTKPWPLIETKKTVVSGSKEGAVRRLNKASDDDDIDVVPILEKSVEEEEDFKRIVQIQKEINQAKDKNLSRLLTGHELIEYVDSNLVVSAYNDRYYLMNPSVISEEFFYQVIIHQFGQFGLLTLSEPVSLRACFCLMTQSEQELRQLQNAVIDQRDILNHQFRFSVTLDGQLESLPMLIKNYVPSVERLPLLLYNIATQVHWEVEVDRLKGLAREFALFYSIGSKMQWEQVVGLLHQNLFQVPNDMASSGYLIELDFPPQFINSHST